MGKRSDALELARFLAFEGRDVAEIARALRVEFGMGEREAMRMALNVLAPTAEVPPLPGGADVGSPWPPD